jgi:hypothetical protein
MNFESTDACIFDDKIERNLAALHATCELNGIWTVEENLHIFECWKKGMLKVL